MKISELLHEHCGCERLEKLDQKKAKWEKKKKKKIAEHLGDLTNDAEDKMYEIFKDEGFDESTSPYTLEFYEGSGNNGRFATGQWTGFDLQWNINKSSLVADLYTGDDPAMKEKLKKRTEKTEEKKAQLVEKGKTVLVKAMKSLKEFGVKGFSINRGDVIKLANLKTDDIPVKSLDVLVFTNDMPD